MKVSDMRVIGRNTAGVRLFHVADKEQVVSAALIEADDDGDDDIGAPDAAIASADMPAAPPPPAEGQDAD
jgi:DNA gyrase subunit A